MAPLNSQDETSGPISTGRHRFLVVLLVAAILSAFLFPVSWQVFVVYLGIGAVIGFLSTFDDLPKVLGLIILIVVSWMDPKWMSSIAPQSHSSRWEPSMIMLGAMSAVILAYVHRPIR
jgi:hypothetical protein